MVEDIRIILVATVLATALTTLLARPVHRFVMRHPNFKVLALTRRAVSPQVCVDLAPCGADR